MSNKALYKNICEQHADLPLFARTWWLDLVCPDWDAAIVVKGDLVKGIWPYQVEQKMGVTLRRTPLLTPYLGPVVFFPADIKDSNRDSYEHETVSELMKQLPEAPVWFLALQPGLKQAGIFKHAGFTPHVQQTFRVSLLPEEHQLLSNMKDTLRRNIRQAEKELTITNSPEHRTELYNYYQKTLSRKNKASGYRPETINAAIDACIANDAGALWVARENNTILAIVWQVWDKNCSYYLMGAQNPEANGYKAMSLLLWHCMKEAKKRGMALFDLEGSMDEGVERFFRGFGGQRELFMVLTRNDSRLWRWKQRIAG